MQIPIHQVAAFADRPFTGNPAAVCPLETWLADDVLQAIARENNLSETAFFAPAGADLALRWFTPACEVELCGHATLAAGWVVLERLGGGDAVTFSTRSGPLGVRRAGELFALDLPALAATADPASAAGLAAALGAAPQQALTSETKLVAVFASAAEVRALKPDFERVARLDRPGVIATALADEGDRDDARDDDAADFVSRFFAPRLGVPEDPVTGAAHAVLVPYWSARLGRDELRAHQVSARGGRLACRLEGERVTLAGRVQPYLEGRLTLEDR